MRIHGAVIKEQGQIFAVVIVKSHIIERKGEAEATIDDFVPIFRMPVILMAQNSRGVPTYYGRADIAKFMANVPLNAIPWKEYTIN